MDLARGVPTQVDSGGTPSGASPETVLLSAVRSPDRAARRSYARVGVDRSCGEDDDCIVVWGGLAALLPRTPRRAPR